MTAIADDVRAIRKRLNEMGARTFTGERFKVYCKATAEPGTPCKGCPTCWYVKDGKDCFRPCPPLEDRAERC